MKRAHDWRVGHRHQSTALVDALLGKPSLQKTGEMAGGYKILRGLPNNRCKKHNFTDFFVYRFRKV